MSAVLRLSSSAAAGPSGSFAKRQTNNILAAQRRGQPRKLKQLTLSSAAWHDPGGNGSDARRGEVKVSALLAPGPVGVVQHDGVSSHEALRGAPSRPWMDGERQAGATQTRSTLPSRCGSWLKKCRCL